MAMMAIQIGMSLAGMLISALFTPKPKDQWGSRISNINAPSVSPGNIIPRMWGTMKLPCTNIFASYLIETMHTHQQSGGKKGFMSGNAAKSYTFTYAIDGAWAICNGPVYKVNRIWANQKLLYVDPVVAANSQAAFDAAYQAEATRLIDEEGVDVDHASCSAFVFAWNNYNTGEVTLTTPSQAVTYIMAHPVDDTAGIYGTILTPSEANVNVIIGQLYSSLNNQNTYESNINRFDLIEIFLGTETQGPSGLLEGYLGQGNAPAFRGVAYFVLTNLQLMDFGNAVPSFLAEVQRTPDGVTSLVQVLTDVCYQAGLVDGEFDTVSNVDAATFPGFAIAANTSAREVFSELQKVFPVDAAESGSRVVFNMLNQRAMQVIDWADLGAHVDTDPLPASQEITVASDYDMPQRIDLKFQEPARAFSVNSLYAARYNTPSRQVDSMDVTIALDRATAQTAINNLLSNRMLAKRAYKMTLPRKYITLEPTDAFKMVNKINSAFYDQYYCTEVHIGANGLLEVHAVDHVWIDPNLKPTDQVADDLSVAAGGNTQLPQTSQTVAFLFDVPLLSDTDLDKPGFYTVLAGAFNSWQGGALLVDAAAQSTATAFGLNILTPTSGSAWEVVASNSINSPHGTVLNVLASGIASGYWDRASELTVLIANGMDLSSSDEDSMLVQPLNATIIGGEVVQFATAIDLGNGLWKVKNFLRGLRGTERLINSHTTGEKFVRLSSSMQRVVTTKADIGVADSFQSASAYSTGTTASTFNFTDTGGSMKPLTVSIYEKFRDNVTHDVRVSWWPRVRQNGQWLSGSDVTLPANDTPEIYQIDICTSADPTTAIKTYELKDTQVNMGASFTYPAANQAIDMATALGHPLPLGPVFLAIYQISQIVGRGFGLGVVV